MNGHILPGSNIAVDYWQIRGRQENLIHFLTHLHGDHTVGLTSSWQRPVYCSEFSSFLLESKYGLPRSLLKVCPLNQSIIVSVSASETFTVTAYNANHCPGAVMFHFQGNFGSIFYTGDFRSSHDIIESCTHLASQIDILYLDNTFCSPKCYFPSRKECEQHIITIIKQHPMHDVLVGIRKLGKESLLVNLGLALNETICVSPEVYQKTQLMFSTNVFTTASLSGEVFRIRAVPHNLITSQYVKDLNMTRPTIAIIPSAIYTGLNYRPFSQDIFIVPYSDHSNFLELFEFVSSLKPGKVCPIVKHHKGPFGEDISDRQDMTLFKSAMGKGRLVSGSTSGMMASVDHHTMSGLIKTRPQKRFMLNPSPLSNHNLASWSPSKGMLFSSVGQLQAKVQTKRKCKKFFKHHLKRAAKGIVYTNSSASDLDCSSASGFDNCQTNRLITNRRAPVLGETNVSSKCAFINRVYTAQFRHAVQVQHSEVESETESFSGESNTCISNNNGDCSTLEVDRSMRKYAMDADARSCFRKPLGHVACNVAYQSSEVNLSPVSFNIAHQYCGVSPSNVAYNSSEIIPSNASEVSLEAFLFNPGAVNNLTASASAVATEPTGNENTKCDRLAKIHLCCSTMVVPDSSPEKFSVTKVDSSVQPLEVRCELTSEQSSCASEEMDNFSVSSVISLNDNLVVCRSLQCNRYPINDKVDISVCDSGMINLTKSSKHPHFFRLDVVGNNLSAGHTEIGTISLAKSSKCANNSKNDIENINKFPFLADSDINMPPEQQTHNGHTLITERKKITQKSALENPKIRLWDFLDLSQSIMCKRLLFDKPGDLQETCG